MDQDPKMPPVFGAKEFYIFVGAVVVLWLMVIK